MRVAIAGAGAAGYFAAISVKEHWPRAQVTILEKSNKVLSKVRVSGGGRCNVCHACFDSRTLSANYPRGERFLRRSFKAFSTRDTVDRFADMGVQLKTEEDGRMFPVTDDSGTVIQALQERADKLGVRVLLSSGVKFIKPLANGGFALNLDTGREYPADKVIITTGGHPDPRGYDRVSALGHSIIRPVPSLFTFNIPNAALHELMGVVIPSARIRLISTDLESTGPLLITHWGMSGPAILRLSAFGARWTHEKNYRFTIQVNWVDGMNEEQIRDTFREADGIIRSKQARNISSFPIPKRAWNYHLVSAGIDPTTSWGRVPKKERNRLIDRLTNDRYDVVGKTTFKEEFVTAGGVSLDEVDPLTLQSKLIPGLYFAGEVLDIDGITGGFNFQAAWTTGYLAGRLADEYPA